MANYILKLAVIVQIICILQVTCADNSSTSSSSATTKTTVFTTTATPDECSIHTNDTCKACLSNSNCLFCSTDNTCIKLELSGILPKGCSLADARWVTCYLNLQALIISVAVIGGVILLITLCCVCYCCNKTCNSITNRNLQRIEKKYQKEKAKRDQLRDERKAERAERYDAIRIKYGLKGGKEYAKMDDNKI